MKKYAHKMQNESDDCGLAVIQTILQEYRINDEKLDNKVWEIFVERKHEYNSQGLSLLDIKEILYKFGIQSEAYEVNDFGKLRKERFPMIAMITNEGMPHYCVIHKMDKEYAIISDPAKMDIEKRENKKLQEIFMGYVICIEEIKKISGNVRERNSSYPEAVVKEAFHAISPNKKIVMTILVAIRALLPMLCTYFLENILHNYIVVFDDISLCLLIIVMGSILVLFYSITRYNAYFKYNLINELQSQIILSYFKNKLQDITAKKNINNISAYFWNILIAVQGLVEKFYLKINLLLTVVLLIILSKYSIILSGIVIIWFVIFLVLVHPLVKKLIKNYKEYISKSNMFASEFEESIRTTLDINSFGKKEASIASFNYRKKHFLSAVIKMADVEEQVRGSLDIIIIIMLLTYAVIYYLLYKAGNLTLLAGILSGIYILYIATSGLNSIFNSYLEYMKSKNAIDYIESKNDFKETIKIEEKKLDFDNIHSIMVNHLSYKYQDIKVLNDKNLIFEQGKVYSISGYNGSGKSTLIKLLCGLLEMQEGNFVYNYQDKCYSSIMGTDIYNYISLYSTEMDVYNQTLINNALFKVFIEIEGRKENLEYKLNQYKMIKHALCLELPDEYVVTSGGTNLSQGQKQKLLLLRTFCKDADVFIFDEPTGNLDQRSENGFIELAKKFAHDFKKIVIIVSHSKHVIDNTDKVYELGGQYEK